MHEFIGRHYDQYVPTPDGLVVAIKLGVGRSGAHKLPQVCANDGAKPEQSMTDRANLHHTDRRMTRFAGDTSFDCQHADQPVATRSPPDAITLVEPVIRLWGSIYLDRERLMYRPHSLPRRCAVGGV